MVKTCPQCGVELVIFPDALGYPEPINGKCLGCGVKLKKKSFLGRIKNMMKWDRY